LETLIYVTKDWATERVVKL